MPDFPNTHLSLIERIRLGDEDARHEALGVFLADYRPALFDFLVKSKGVSHADADDLVQGFIEKKIMQGGVLSLANKTSRFRSALRRSLQNYLIDHLRKKNRERLDASASVQDEGCNPDEGLDPLDRLWAVAVFGNALTQMKMECVHWGLFVDRVLTQPPLGYEKIIAKYGYDTPQKASNFLMTAKRTFNRILSSCVEAQSSLSCDIDDEDVDSEVALLRVLLADPAIVSEAVHMVKGRAIESRSLLWATAAGGDAISFLDPTADAAWGMEDIGWLMHHLLKQPVSDFVPDTSLTASLCEVLTCECDPVSIIPLKEYFNQRGKHGKSDLPRRIDVTMTFALMARYVTLGGELQAITSMSLQDLQSRISQYDSKKWLPADVENVFRLALAFREA